MARVRIWLSLVSVIGLLLAAAGGARVARSGAAAVQDEPEPHGEFTGEILPVFYVRDVRRSVAFYRDILGFHFEHYWDYEAGRGVKDWEKPDPPIYAKMQAGPLVFGLHRADKPDELRVGGTRHYFRLRDVEAHHRRIKGRGMDVAPIVERPWMRMFTVVDPDGHLIVFNTPPE